MPLKIRLSLLVLLMLGIFLTKITIEQSGIAHASSEKNITTERP